MLSFSQPILKLSILQVGVRQQIPQRQLFVLETTRGSQQLISLLLQIGYLLLIVFFESRHVFGVLVVVLVDVGCHFGDVALVVLQ